MSPAMIFLAGQRLRERRPPADRPTHALNRRRNFLAAHETQQRERAAGDPAPARGENRRGEDGLFEHLSRREWRMQKVKNVGQRKTVLFAERNIQAVVRGRGLQLEIERAAEALAQRKSPGFIDAAAEWRVNHQLHAAAFVEKALGDDGRLRGHGAQHGAACRQCIRWPARRRRGPGRIRLSANLRPRQLAANCADRREGARPSGSAANVFAHVSNLRRKFIGARGSFAAPERNVGRRALRIFHQDTDRTCTRRMRHEVFPRSMMSPRKLSTAKSSSTVPTTVPSGSATTV